MSGCKLIILIFLSLSVLSCATKPFPYFDSALNDHNRAPASFSIQSWNDFDLKQESASEASDIRPADLSRNAQADVAFIQGELASFSGKTDLAIEFFKEASALNETSATIDYKLAIEYYRKGQLKDAIYWSEKAYKKNPDHKEVILFLAGLMTAKKEYEQAEKLYKKAIEKFPQETDAYLYLGALYSETQNYAGSLKYFNLLIQFKDKDQSYLGYYYRARLKLENINKSNLNDIESDLRKTLQLKSDFFEAIQLLSKVIEKKSGKKKSYDFLAGYQKQFGPINKLAEVLSQYFIEIGDYKNAYDQLELIESSSDDQIQIKLKMALILIDQKKYNFAQIKLLELQNLVPESDKVKFYLSAVLQENKQEDQAIKTFLSIEKESSYFEEAQLHAALLLKNQGNLERAESVLRESIKTKAKNIQTYFVLAQIYEESKKYGSAIELLKEIRKNNSNDIQIEYYLGILNDKMNDKEKMFQHMNQVLKFDPNHIQALNYVAYSLVELEKDLEIAETYALRALKLDQKDGYIKDTLGWIYYKKGNYVKAVEILEKAHQLLPDVGIIADHLGDAYLKLNQNEKAVSTFQKAIDLETDLQKKKAIQNKLAELQKINDSRSPASEK